MIPNGKDTVLKTVARKGVQVRFLSPPPQISPHSLTDKVIACGAVDEGSIPSGDTVTFTLAPLKVCLERNRKMKRRKPSNRLPSLPSDKEKAVRQKLEEAAKRKRTEKVIRTFQRQFPGKSLLQLLPVMSRHCSSKEVIRRVIERIEQNQGKGLSFEDRCFLEGIKKGLREDEKEEEKCHELRRCFKKRQRLS